MMTKRHYVTLAAAIAAAVAHDPTGGREQSFSVALRDARRDALRDAADKIADALQADNPRFHRERFLTAAGFAVPYTDPPAPSWQGQAFAPGRGKRRAFVPLSERQSKARNPGV